MNLKYFEGQNIFNHWFKFKTITYHAEIKKKNIFNIWYGCRQGWLAVLASIAKMHCMYAFWFYGMQCFPLIEVFNSEE